MYKLNIKPLSSFYSYLLCMLNEIAEIAPHQDSEE